MRTTLDWQTIIRLLKKYEIIIASVFVILAVCVSTWLFLFPNFNKAKEIFLQEESLNKQIINLDKKEKILSDIDYSFYKDNYPKVISVLPETKDFVSLFYTLDNLEGKTGVSIIRTEFQLGVISATSKKQVKDKDSAAFKMPITVEIVGDPSQIQNFIEKAKDLSGRLIIIEEIRITLKEKNLIQATLTGQAYFYPSLASIGSVDSSLSVLTEEQRQVLTKISQQVITGKKETEFGNIEVGKKNLFQ